MNYINNVGGLFLRERYHFRVLGKFNICKILLGNLLSMIINKYIPNLL